MGSLVGAAELLRPLRRVSITVLRDLRHVGPDYLPRTGPDLGDEVGDAARRPLASLPHDGRQVFATFVRVAAKNIGTAVTGDLPQRRNDLGLRARRHDRSGADE